MLALRKAKERGRAYYGWLNSYHTFSFANYYDPKHMGFRHLRVINEDRVSPGRGFGAHPHRDMEIFSYVVEGSLEHKDSTGGRSVILPGEVQLVSAGTGILHSEYNPSATEDVRFLQIWILPDRRGLEPNYQQRFFSPEEKQNRLCLFLSPDGRENSLQINQNAFAYSSFLDASKEIETAIAPQRHVWVQVINGAIAANDIPMQAGDGMAIENADKVHLVGEENAEFLLFDLV